MLICFLKSKTVSNLLCYEIHHVMLCDIETVKPTMKDLNRYVINKFAIYWRDIGFELDLECSKIDNIQANCNECEECLYEVLKAWLQLDKNVSWNALVVAIINARRLKSGKDPIDCVDGKDVLRILEHKIITYTYVRTYVENTIRYGSTYVIVGVNKK